MGRVYVPSGEMGWADSHARVPTSWMPQPSRIRIYVAFLDRDRIGRIGFVDVDAKNPLQILRISKTAVLDTGKPGSFDEHGVSPSCLVQAGGRLYLYYSGWRRGQAERYRLMEGLAVSVDGGETFQRLLKTPLLAENNNERFVRTTPFVQRSEQEWRMWYTSGNQWVDVKGKEVPFYGIRRLQSSEFDCWTGCGVKSLEPEGVDEYGLARPIVFFQQGSYRMWFSIRTRSQGYRMGYAESRDGLSWTRQADPKAVIMPSIYGWDSEMICFGWIQKTERKTYMFYNGNNYGETGFGVAVLQKDLME